MRVVSRVDLPPGVTSCAWRRSTRGSQLAGSVYYDLEVPGLQRGPARDERPRAHVRRLAAVGPVVGIAPDDELRRALPGPPTVAREFQADEELAATRRGVRQRRRPRRTGWTSATTLRSDDGREVFRIADERSSSELQGARGGYGYTARVPLKGLAPGLYVLRVEARSTLGKAPTVSREVHGQAWSR